jgi:hypothetical protein
MDTAFLQVYFCVIKSIKRKCAGQNNGIEFIYHRSYSLIKKNNTKGKIQKGFYSDIVILDKDYFFIADDEMPALNAVLTIVDRKVVYSA